MLAEFTLNWSPNGIVSVLALAGASVGHAFLMMTALNVFYAWPLSHAVLKHTRKVDLLVIVAGPLLFWYALGLHDGQGLRWEPGTARSLLIPYTLICIVLGVVGYPLCTLLYWLRRPPRSLLSNDTITLDVARELGYPPAGTGKHRRLTRLPLNQCFQVDFSERTFELPQLPAAWDGLRILHLSDLHFCGTPDKNFYRCVIDKCREMWQPDIVAVTGDIVDSDSHHSWIIPVLGRLHVLTPSPPGGEGMGVRGRYAFAILGNHDSWLDETGIRRRLRRIGMDVIGNGWRQVDVRGVPMIVIGHEGPWFTPIPDLSDCPLTLPSPPGGEGRGKIFRLCLSHTPDHINWAKRHGIDLVLAGHVHGGQIRLPVIGSVFVPSRYSRHYDCGSFFEPPTLMHVSRGLAGQHPLRFNCRPEVTCIVLRRPIRPDTRGTHGQETAENHPQ